jgi:hypothetical protein
MVFSIQSATEAKNGHLKITIIASKEKTATGRSEGKVILSLYFDSSGMVHVEFIPHGGTVNKNKYKENLICLRDFQFLVSVMGFGIGIIANADI